MATSGQVNTNTEYASYFWVKWEQVGNQDIANNRTLINWYCGVSCGHSFFSNAIKMSPVIINGIQVYNGGTYSNLAHGDFTLASGSMWIDHNADGTKTFSISPFTGWLYSNHNYASNGESYTLTSIPRQATLTAAPDFTDLDNPTITYSNPAGDAATALEACISLTRANDDVKYRAIPKTGTSYTFNLTDDERNLLRNNTTGPNRTVYFYVRTKFGSTQFHSAEGKTFTVVESDYTRPTLTMRVNLNNELLPSKFAEMYIQGKSKVDVSLSADGKYGASIANYWIEIDDKKYGAKSLTSDAIQRAGKVEIVGYAKDSRGFICTAEQSIDVIEYSKPSATVIAYRCNSSGEEDPEGAYMRVGFTGTITSLDGKNSAHYTIDYGGTPITGTGTSYISDPIACDVSRVRSVEVKVSDDIDSTIKAAVIPIAFTLMDFYRTGKGIAFGQVATRDGFDCALDAYFGANVTLNKGFIDGSDTGWQAINECISYRCKCGYVTIIGISNGEVTLTAGDYMVVGNVPTQYAPKIRTPLVFHTVGGSPVAQSGYIEHAGTAGDIRLYTNVGGTSYWAFTATYPL
jgi:hypothetical protein